jgi:hypothetical protein
MAVHATTYLQASNTAILILDGQRLLVEHLQHERQAMRTNSVDQLDRAFVPGLVEWNASLLHCFDAVSTTPHCATTRPNAISRVHTANLRSSSAPIDDTAINARYLYNDNKYAGSHDSSTELATLGDKAAKFTLGFCNTLKYAHGPGVGFPAFASRNDFIKNRAHCRSITMKSPSAVVCQT